MRVTLLGPQRSPSLRSVVRSLGVDGPVATVTAGWQEREPDDGEVDAQVDFRGVNLCLYARWLDVIERDPELAAAESRRRQVLGELQELYLIRLDHALQAAYTIGRLAGEHTRRPAGDHTRRPTGEHIRRPAGDALLSEALTEAVTAVRDLDTAHLARIASLDAEFYHTWRPQDRPAIAGHRAEVARVLDGAGAMVVAGGHVGVLSAVLHLFHVAAAVRCPVVAWSAGAMALSDRILLFHDRTPQGPGQPEVFGRGLSLFRGVVPLPHARARLLLDDTVRMAVLARRLAPARCLPLENGVRVDTDTDGACPPGTRVLGEDGRIAATAAA